MTEPRSAGGRPMSVRIADDLREVIARASPGDRLPSLSDLMERYGTTHTTVAKAYAKLIAEGLVEARRWVGYFVRDSSRITWDRTRSLNRAEMDKLPLDGEGNPVDTWAYDATLAGYSHRQDITVVTVTADEEIGGHALADLFGVPGDTLLTGRRRVRFIGPAGIPAKTPESLFDSYYIGDIVQGSAIAAPGTVNTTRVLAAMGHGLTEHIETVRPRIATAEEAEKLALPGVTAVVEVIRVSTDADGRPVLVQHLITPNPLRYNLWSRP